MCLLLLFLLLFLPPRKNHAGWWFAKKKVRTDSLEVNSCLCALGPHECSSNNDDGVRLGLAGAVVAALAAGAAAAAAGFSFRPCDGASDGHLIIEEERKETLTYNFLKHARCLPPRPAREAEGRKYEPCSNYFGVECRRKVQRLGTPR